MVSQQSTRSVRTRVATKRGHSERPSNGVDRLLRASAVLQKGLSFEQQLVHALEVAREDVGVDRLHVWAAAPGDDRLIHVAGSGMSKEDRLSLGERTEIPLA